MATHSNVGTTLEAPNSNNSTLESNHNPTLNDAREANSVATTNGVAVARSEQSKKPNTQAIKRRARAILRDMSIGSESQVYVRFALETDDPWLPDLVQRVEQGEDLGETFNFSSH